jgi:hypothetical protein
MPTCRPWSGSSVQVVGAWGWSVLSPWPYTPVLLLELVFSMRVPAATVTVEVFRSLERRRVPSKTTQATWADQAGDQGQGSRLSTFTVAGS